MRVLDWYGEACASYRLSAWGTAPYHPPPPPKAVRRLGNQRSVCTGFEIREILAEHCSKELEKLRRLCIISNVTYYRNGARGGRLRAA